MTLKDDREPTISNTSLDDADPTVSKTEMQDIGEEIPLNTIKRFVHIQSRNKIRLGLPLADLTTYFLRKGNVIKGGPALDASVLIRRDKLWKNSGKPPIDQF